MAEPRDETGIVVTITLPDGSTVQAIEVEVETAWEGPSYLAQQVPYVVPVDWQNGWQEMKPSSVRLFAVGDFASHQREEGRS